MKAGEDPTWTREHSRTPKDRDL